MTMTDVGLGTATVTSQQQPQTGITLPDGSVISLDEAAQGYMRQQDYTRKTQDVANQRKLAERGLILLEALDQDPNGAIALIASEYQIQAPTAPRATTAPVEDDGWGNPTKPESGDTPEVAFLKGELAKLQSTVGTVAQQQQKTVLMQELDAVASKYGEFDQGEVLRHMQANGIPTVEMAYRDLNWDSAPAVTQANVGEDQQVLDQKRQLAGVVAAGGGIPGSATATEPKQYGAAHQGSWRNALSEALRDSAAELGADGVTDPLLNG